MHIMRGRPTRRQKTTLGDGVLPSPGGPAFPQQAVEGQFDDSPHDQAIGRQGQIPPFLPHPRTSLSQAPRPEGKSRANPRKRSIAQSVGDIGTQTTRPAHEMFAESLACQAETRENNVAGGVLENEFTEADVLFGRGGGTNNHIGNRYFRALIVHYRPNYALSKKVDKQKITRAVVMAVRAVGGRFLKKDDASGNWVDVGDKKASDKASQAMRDGNPSKARKILSRQDDYSPNFSQEDESVCSSTGEVGDDEGGLVLPIFPPKTPEQKRRRLVHL